MAGVELQGDSLRALELERSVVDFIEEEARILDDHQFEVWEELWEPDGVYWLPQDIKHDDPEKKVSLVYDDRAAITRRVDRLSGRLAFALQPAAEVSRMTGNVRIAGFADDLVVAQSRFMMVVYRREHPVVYGGRVEHHLRERPGQGYGMVFKRVDLVGAGASFENFTVVF
ncbi:MAG TPA: aromatic-ring-hydroxylating dioxygenase subunit beta [Acidimicrobiales bacterium]|jgi:3-phenylpropionate/cinnamic acid dioxygenase small subunit|nr:aromatic-ring-hydroxylating dioxygenase subunit beta [Acidimicrobiales bacterium]